MPDGMPSIYGSTGSRRLARLVIEVLLLTFIATRAIEFYFRLGPPQPGRVNYGVILLVVVGAYLLVRRPHGGALQLSAILYAIGLALTLDDFGMRFHGKRAIFDAIVVIAAILLLIAFAPPLRHFQPRHWVMTLVFIGVVTWFGVMLLKSGNRVPAVNPSTQPAHGERDSAADPL